MIDAKEYVLRVFIELAGKPSGPFNNPFNIAAIKQLEKEGFVEIIENDNGTVRCRLKL